MVRRRPRSYGWRVAALAILTGWAASACGDDELTWPDPASLSELFGNQLYRADGSTVGVGALDDTTLIGIYFSNPGCPACSSFYPFLLDTYEQLREDGRSFEVVLVAQGIGDSSLSSYMVDWSMPWLAVLPQSSSATALAQRYNLRWVPTLVIIDGEGTTISVTGRDEVIQVGAAAYDVWLASSGGS